MWILSQDRWSTFERLSSDPDPSNYRLTNILTQANQNKRKSISDLDDMIYNLLTPMYPKV